MSIPDFDQLGKMMILNDLEYQTTKERVAGFQRALVILNQPNNEIKSKNHWLWQSNIDGLHQLIAKFNEQIQDYEKLISRDRNEPLIFEVNSIEELPLILIKVRIVTGITQKELAEKLGVSEVQMQRFEEWEYQEATLSKLLEASRVLGISIQNKITLEVFSITKVA